MSSIPIKRAEAEYVGATEQEILRMLAEASGCSRIYKYANDYGDKVTHTDYKYVPFAGHPQEEALFSSPYVHNVVLVYDDGKTINI